jgi:hypothetical protein
LYFLGQYTDIDPVGTIVSKPVKPKSVVETTKQNDIVLERNIGPAAAAPAPETSAAETSTPSVASRCCKPKTSAGATRNV